MTNGKIVVFFLFTVLSLNCFAKNKYSVLKVRVENYESTQFSYMTELITGELDKKVILDCQSFFNQLNYYSLGTNNKYELRESIKLTAKSCAAISKRVYSSVDNNDILCIEYVKDLDRFYFSEKNDDCR